MTRTHLALAALSLALAGCSLVADFSRYTPRDGVDGGDLIDADGPDADLPDASTDGGTSECSPACGTTEGCCGDVCTSLETVDNCGGCGIACVAANAAGSCTSRQCVFECDAGFADCDGDPSNGCEESLLDAGHCGGCGQGCASGELCVAGASPEQNSCEDSCPSGQTECNGGCHDLSSSVLHCGSCGNDCGSVVRATATCEANACVYTCNPATIACAPSGLPEDGCGTAMSQFRDADGDRFGDFNMQIEACSLQSGYVLMPDDCDDTDGSRYPNNPELCDGVDNDCDDITDEEAMGSGATCQCVPGSDEGRTVCESTSGELVCSYAVEGCNGLDDDCDDDVDEAFTCTMGVEAACSITVAGCTHPGTQTCLGDCSGFGACVADGESCDRMEEDCDGIIDEGTMITNAISSLVSAGSDPYVGVRAHVAHMRAEVGVVYSTGVAGWLEVFTDDGVRVFRRELDHDIAVDPARELASIDVTWSGTHWVVASINASNPLFRNAQVTVFTEDGTETDGSALPMSNSGAFGIRADRVGGSDQIAFAWHDTSGGQRMLLGRARVNGSGIVEDPIVNVANNSGGSRLLLEPEVVNVGTAAQAVWSEFVDGGSNPARLQTATIDAGSDTWPFQNLLTGTPQERDVAMAYAPGTGQIGLLFLETLTTGQQALSVGIFVAGSVQTRMLAGPAMSPTRHSIAAANDGSFGVFWDDNAGGHFMRIDANTLATWESHTFAGQIDQFYVGFYGGDRRYRGFGLSSAGDIVAQDLVCR